MSQGFMDGTATFYAIYALGFIFRKRSMFYAFYAVNAECDHIHRSTIIENITAFCRETAVIEVCGMIEHRRPVERWLVNEPQCINTPCNTQTICSESLSLSFTVTVSLFSRKIPRGDGHISAAL
jgi:hypothetical protein